MIRWILLIGCLSVELNSLASAETLSWQGRQATVRIETQPNGLRSFWLTTNEILRESIPTASELVISERLEEPRIVTNSGMFDAIFALAVDEARANAVEQISDPSFLSASCSCFVAGRKWPYVWTRDTAYAIFLGLGALDPERAKRSLLFKISPDRQGNGLQIVQDTGSGGSWPVSTDRVSWVLGAAELLSQLNGTEASGFSDTAFEALVQTIHADRLAAFDPSKGLYFGEQSFLDWREQSNPPWTAGNVVPIAESAAMSTNVLHYVAITTAAKWARQRGLADQAAEFEHWASQLKDRINAAFWDQQSGLYRSLTGPTLNPASVRRFDLLAQSLAVLFGVASKERSKSIFASYPLTEAGAPVQWPQDPVAPIYHNRAIWPFVSAIAAKAAARSGNAAFVDINLRSLLRGAALNLSHMENFEFTTLANHLTDGERSGPVVNSQRQLWSVAAFTGAVTDVLFGKQSCAGGLRFDPFVPSNFHREVWHSAAKVYGFNFRHGGKSIDVEMQFAATGESKSSGEFFGPQLIRLNGEALSPADCIDAEDLLPHNQVIVQLSKQTNATGFRMLPISRPPALTESEYRAWFAPVTPQIYSVEPDQKSIKVAFSAPPSRIGVNIYRDGALIASGIKSSVWRDTASALNQSHCYAVTHAFDGTSHESYPSETLCHWPQGSVFELSVTAAQFLGSVPAFGRRNGRTYASLSESAHLQFDEVEIMKSGLYGLQFIYANRGPISTGITAALRRIEIIDQSTEQAIATNMTVLPHTGEDEVWRESRMVLAHLVAGRKYRFKIEDFDNMSSLAHFETYLSRGGASGADNRFDFAGIRFLQL